MNKTTTPVTSVSTAEEQRTFPERVVEVITLEMGKQSISSAQLAESTGISPEALRLMLNDQKTMYMGDLYNIATALGWKVPELMIAAGSGDAR